MSIKTMTSISIVIPLYNEEENVVPLHEEIVKVCRKESYDFEIIMVDDGSTDNTYQNARELAPLHYIRFRKNYGQTAAMDAGIKAASKQYIVTMDGDRQNDPNDIPRLIAHLENNHFDVVSGWRKQRKDKFLKRFTSRGANLLRKMLINDRIHDSGCSLKVYRKECFENVNIFGEMHRFIPAILQIKGFQVGELVVNHRPRTTGKTKYNWKRTLRGFVDMISVWFWNKYAVRPLHLLGGIAFVFFFLSIICLGITIYQFAIGISMSDTAFPLLSGILMLTALQFFISGLILDVTSKQYFLTTNDVSYNVKENFKN